MKRFHPQEPSDLTEISLKDYLDPRRVNCLYCERFFKSQNAHDNHMKRAHPRELMGLQPASPEIVVDEEEENDEEENFYICM